MLWLTCYYDAAGHPKGKHALVVGGYVAAVPAWLRFEREWKRALNKAGIDVFHMADFMARKGKFENWKGRDHEQARLLLKLVQITNKHARISFSTIILLDAWESVNKTYALREAHCTPYALCGFFTILRTAGWLWRRDRRFKAELIFEDGDLNKGDLIWMIDRFTGHKKKILGGLFPTFKGKELSPLQAADFVAWEHLNAARERLLKPDVPAGLRETFKKLETIKKSWRIITEDQLLKFCADYDVPKRDSLPRDWASS